MLGCNVYWRLKMCLLLPMILFPYFVGCSNDNNVNSVNSGDYMHWEERYRVAAENRNISFPVQSAIKDIGWQKTLHLLNRVSSKYDVIAYDGNDRVAYVDTDKRVDIDCDGNRIVGDVVYLERIAPDTSEPIKMTVWMCEHGERVSNINYTSDGLKVIYINRDRTKENTYVIHWRSGEDPAAGILPEIKHDQSR